MNRAFVNSVRQQAAHDAMDASPIRIRIHAPHVQVRRRLQEGTVVEEL